MNGKPRSWCGRCGRVISERKAGKVRYCKDCLAVDPAFCGWGEE